MECVVIVRQLNLLPFSQQWEPWGLCSLCTIISNNTLEITMLVAKKLYFMLLLIKVLS